MVIMRQLPVIHQPFINAVQGHMTGLGIVPIEAPVDASIDALASPAVLAERYALPMDQAARRFHDGVSAYVRAEEIPSVVRKAHDELVAGRMLGEKYFDAVAEIMGLGAAYATGFDALYMNKAPSIRFDAIVTDKYGTCVGFSDVGTGIRFDELTPDEMRLFDKRRYFGQYAFQLVSSRTNRVMQVAEEFERYHMGSFSPPAGVPWYFRTMYASGPRYFIRTEETLGDHLRAAEQLTDASERMIRLVQIAGSAAQGGFPDRALEILLKLTEEVGGLHGEAKDEVVKVMREWIALGGLGDRREKIFERLPEARELPLEDIAY